MALVGDAHCAEAQAQPQGFSVPVSCDPNSECLVQQYPDMMPGSGVADPFCGQASYDGHDGTDIRIASLKSVAAGVPVVAMRDGRVLRLRDGEPDRLIETAAARETVASKECGNGLVIDHGDGWSVQYCHLRQGSIRVRPGQFVKRGEQLGLVGASGLAQFPHVHVTVRRSGLAVDPATGQEVGSGCIRNAPQRRPLWALEALGWLKAAQHHIIDAGLTGTTLDYDNLVREGAPPAINKDSAAVVGWGWFANLAPGDTIRIRIAAPDGKLLIDSIGNPLAGPKAVYAQMAGRRVKAEAGAYNLLVELARDGAVLEARRRRIEVR